MVPKSPRGWATIIDEFTAWMAARGYSPQTIDLRLRCIGYFMAWAGRRLPPTARRLRAPLLRAYTLELASQRTGSGALIAASTRSTRVYALRSFVRWLHSFRHHRSDLRDSLEPPRLPRALPPAVMNVREAERVVAAARPTTPLRLRDRTLLELLYSTAMRRRELATLRVEDVDRERRVVCIRVGKGGKGRVVPLGERAAWWLARYLRRSRPVMATADEHVLFVSRRGRALAVNRVGDIVRDYVLASGIQKRGSCHMFRHSVASLMLDAGADIRFIQELLGHERLTSTQIYTRVSITALKTVHARTHPAERSGRRAPGSDRTAPLKGRRARPSEGASGSVASTP